MLCLPACLSVCLSACLSSYLNPLLSAYDQRLAELQQQLTGKAEAVAAIEQQVGLLAARRSLPAASWTAMQQQRNA